MVSENGVKNIQAAAYNGARTATNFNPPKRLNNPTNTQPVFTI